jgi:hypothetical protein
VPFLGNGYGSGSGFARVLKIQDLDMVGKFHIQKYNKKILNFKKHIQS